MDQTSLSIRATRGGNNPGRPDLDREAVRYFVYRLLDASGDVVYIGRSANVAKRLRSHKGKDWLAHVREVTMTGPMKWDDAVAAEREEIARLQPWGNIALTARDHRPFTAHMSARAAETA